MFALHAGEAEAAKGSGGVFEEPGLEFWIGPRLGYHLGAVPWTHFVLEGINEGIKGIRVYHSLFQKDGFDSLHPKRRVRRQQGMGGAAMAMCMTFFFAFPVHRQTPFPFDCILQ